MSRFFEKHPAIYTPIIIAMMTAVFFFIALMPLFLFGYALPYWVWLCMMISIILGIIMQIGTKRVVYIHAYTSIVFILLLTFYSSVLILSLARSQGEDEQVFVRVLVIGMLSLITIIWFILDQRKTERNQMPYGPQGKLNPKTGIIIDKTYWPVSFSERTENNKYSGWVIRASPLIAGMAIAFTRGLSITGKMIFISLTIAFIATLVAIVSGSVLSYLISTIRWEREHSLQIYLGE